MIKITFCLMRRPDLTREEFLAYWYDKHRLLMLEVKGHHPVPALHPNSIASHRKFRRAGTSKPGRAARFRRSCQEAWYDSFEERAKRPQDPAADSRPLPRLADVLVEDEKNFIDLSRSPIFWGEEKIVVPGDPAHFLVMKDLVFGPADLLGGDDGNA